MAENNVISLADAKFQLAVEAARRDHVRKLAERLPVLTTPHQREIEAALIAKRNETQS